MQSLKRNLKPNKTGKCVVDQAGVYSNWAYPDGRKWIEDETGL